jgi:elongation factor Ts
MRKSGLAKADKKAARGGAEGTVAVERAGNTAVLVEVNCETDFVARGDEFQGFARSVARAALEKAPADVNALVALSSGASTLDEQRRVLIAKIGENISVRRFSRVTSQGALGAYIHGGRIGALVALKGGDEALARDLAMHVTAANPAYIDAAGVPSAVLDKEREILAEQTKAEKKPPEIIAKMVEGRLRKYLAEITLVGQPFVKDPDTTVEKLLKASGATVVQFVRYAVGEGIEKKQDDFVSEVMAQVKAQSKPEGDGAGGDPKDGPKKH